MRIAFLTTCLQSGRDGVGDYTSGLAEECALSGHEVFRMALNDPYADPFIEELGCIRLGASMSWPERIEKGRKALEAFRPDWVSLQFVCYGFHPRGTDLKLGERLKALIGDVPLQIMFHELWIGCEQGAGWKDRVTGTVQRVGVKRALARLRPRVVHTTNPAYRAVLAENGVTARRLPLFGSVPIPDSSLCSKGQGYTVPRERAEWRFGIFGTLHPIWPPQPLLERLIATGRRITITHIGNIGRGESLWKQLYQDYGGKIRFECLGELSPEGVAEAFAALDFGISATPWEIAGKSASLASMLEHGLPVVVNRDDVHYRGWLEEGYSPLLTKMDGDLATRLDGARRQPPHSRRREVALQFLRDWEEAS